MKQKFILLLIVVAIIGIGALIVKGKLASQSSSGGTATVPKNQQTVKGKPVDVVLDFYDSWLKDLTSTSTDPYKSGLAKSPLLSPTLRDRVSVQGTTDGLVEGMNMIDPVLCENAIPKTLSGRELFNFPNDKAEVVVFSKAQPQSGQAVVTLKAKDGGWYIDDILCSRGEFAPPREYTFEEDGNLLKASVPKPYDPTKWHIVFTQKNEPGHVAPLFFTSTSTCTSLAGDKSACDPSQFKEAEKVHVQGSMSETGVTVAHMQFIK